MKAILQPLSCAILLAASALAGAADLTLRVDDVKSAQGNLMVSVFDSAASFMRKPVANAIVPAVAGATTVMLKDLPAGSYAIAIFHDANSNGKMDKNLVGIPTEDYAFSNNAVGQMGPPSFESARLELPAAGGVAIVSLR
ncbi:DUF2141 domain-containing protein [Oxalobacteraceae bacterium]|nr:DUF2141 domain-containing protein [Oxalobacteraceae bacterium]